MLLNMWLDFDSYLTCVYRVPVTEFLLCLSKFQVVPHITDAIRNWIESVAIIPVDGKEGPADVCVIELGGTVGKSYVEKRYIQCIENSVWVLWFCMEGIIYALSSLQVTLNQCHSLRLCDSYPFQLVGHIIYCNFKEHYWFCLRIFVL